LLLAARRGGRLRSAAGRAPLRCVVAGASGLCLGLAVSAWHAERLLEARLPAHCERLPLLVRGVVSELPRRGGSGERQWQRLRLELDAILPGHCAGPRRALLSVYEPIGVQPGELWEFQVVPRVPWGTANPAGFNAAAWYARERIDMVGSVRSGGARRLRAPAGLTTVHQRLRARMVQALDAQLGEGPAAALLRALVVGDRSAIDERLWRELQAWGVTHLLVISGLHIALVAAAGLYCGRVLGRLGLLFGWAHATRWCPTLCALLCALAYTALAGFSAPTVRALVMSACFLLASVLGRHARSGRNLLLAAWVLLLCNPMLALGGGFWLSFGAVAALLWLLGWSEPASRWRTTLRVHGYMSLAMLPLGALWFQGGSLLALPANLVAAPLVGFWVVPLALLGAVCLWCLPALSDWCWQAAAWPLLLLLEGFTRVAEQGSAFGYLALAPGPLGLGCALIAVALQALPLPRSLRWFSLVLLLPLILPDRSAPPWQAQLSVLDVGQGTAVVLRSAGHTLVYDTGGGDPHGANHALRSVLPFLRQQGVRRVDDLIISHADTDHSAGTAALLKQMPVQRIHLGELLDAAPAGRLCRAGRRWQWSENVEFLTLTAGRPSALEGNAASCVLRVDVAGLRFLLTGDLGVEGERELVRYWRDELRADWLLVGHHGSATSTATAFLRWVRPRIAVLSHARANAFGHPHPQVLKRLHQADVLVHSTAVRGALHYTVYPDGRLRVHAERDGYQPYWVGRHPDSTPAR